MHARVRLLAKITRIFRSLFSLVKPKALEGVLEPNKFLENPEKLFLGSVHGPEHLLNRNGLIYTAMHNGDLVEIIGDHIKILGKFGAPCREWRSSVKH